MSSLETMFQFLLFPGIVFTATAGLATSWLDRKVKPGASKPFSKYNAALKVRQCLDAQST